MTIVVGDISISLDGFVTGPNPGPENGLGDGGEALHTWAFSDDPVDREQLRSATASSGAVVLGRNLFDVLSLHLSPVVLGDGTPLFVGGHGHTLVQRSATPSTTAVHVVYDVVR